MNTAANFINPTLQAKVSAVKPVTNTTKNTSSSSGQQQEKKFSDILDQAEAETSVPKEPEAKQVPEPMPGISGFNPVIAMVDVSTIPITEIVADQEIAGSEVPRMSIFPSHSAQIEGMEQSVAESLANTVGLQEPQVEFSSVLKIMEQPQAVDRNNFPGNQIVADNAAKTQGESLLNLLNGKVTQNVLQATKPVDSSMNTVKQDVDMQAEAMQIPVQIVDETNHFGVKVSPADVPPQPVVKEDSGAKKMKHSPILSVEDEPGLHQEPLRAAREAQEQSMDFGSKQNFDLAANSLKKTSADTITKESETTGQQQFGQFAVNAAGIRTDSIAARQASAAQPPEQLEKFDIPGQIVQQARLIKTNEDTQMVIKLRPEHLGDLTLKVTVENGVVSASFHSDNSQVRSMLETTLMQLKQELIDQGIKVNNVSVYAGMGQSLPDKQGQQQTGREQQSTRYKNRKIDLADFEDEVGKVSALQPDVSGQDGVDYRV